MSQQRFDHISECCQISEDWKLTFAKTGKRKNVKVNDYSLTLDMAKELSIVESNLSSFSSRHSAS